MQVIGIGRNIAAERERLMWKQEELAQAMADAGHPMTGKALGNIERGSRAARADEVNAIAEILGVPLDVLMRTPEWIEEANLPPRLVSSVGAGASGTFPDAPGGAIPG
jgi:transcriptional regulator with XRE-family HTH domain